VKISNIKFKMENYTAQGILDKHKMLERGSAKEKN
jgi:hypothetical protein